MDKQNGDIVRTNKSEIKEKVEPRTQKGMIKIIQIVNQKKKMANKNKF